MVLNYKKLWYNNKKGVFFMIYYHGTIIGNEGFSEKYNQEESSNRDGACIYLTSDMSDAVANYASPYSNDNRAKICMLIDRGLINQTVMECADYVFSKHSPKILTCSVKYNRPFVSSKKQIDESQPEYKNLRHSVSEFLVAKGIFHETNRALVEAINKKIYSKKTSQEILNYLRFDAINDALEVFPEIKNLMGRNTSFSPCLFNRFDAIIDRCAGDDWNVNEGVEHIIINDASRIKVSNVRTITPDEALLLRNYHCQPAHPQKSPELFDCYKQFGWKKTNIQEPELGM